MSSTEFHALADRYEKLAAAARTDADRNRYIEMAWDARYNANHIDD